MNQLVCLQDFEEKAYQIVDQNARNYIKSGADDEITVVENIKAFKRLMINARILRDVSTRDLSTEVLGKKVAFPIGIGPTTAQKLVHDLGEAASAKAAGVLNTIFTLSGSSSTSLEEVAAANPGGRKWYNIYLCKDRNQTVNLIRHAEALGFEAFVVSPDIAVHPKRRANRRNLFKIPKHIKLANLDEWAKGTQHEVNGSVDHSLLTFFDFIQRDLTWEDINWFKSNTKLPIILKGVMSPEDAAIAVSIGVNAIWVSNHGGRLLDTAPATIDVLPEIVAAVKGQCEVYLDSGVRTGTDVFKALALGARMVFLGRPIMWGLAVGGEEGVKRILEILKEELDTTMALAGVTNIARLDSSYIRKSCCDNFKT